MRPPTVGKNKFKFSVGDKSQVWANRKINPEAPDWGVRACSSPRTSLWAPRKAERQHWGPGSSVVQAWRGGVTLLVKRHRAPYHEYSPKRTKALNYWGLCSKFHHTGGTDKDPLHLWGGRADNSAELPTRGLPQLGRDPQGASAPHPHPFIEQRIQIQR